MTDGGSLTVTSFLNDAERIATRNYQPTDDDVIRARLRTLGVQEYRFIFDHGEFDHSMMSFLFDLFMSSRSGSGSRMEAVRCRGHTEQCKSNLLKICMQRLIPLP